MKYKIHIYIYIIYVSGQPYEKQSADRGSTTSLTFSMILVTNRVGQNRIYTPYITVYLKKRLLKIPYIHRIYMVLANPKLLIIIVTCHLIKAAIPTHARNLPTRVYTHTHTHRHTRSVLCACTCVTLTLNPWNLPTRGAYLSCCYTDNVK
jgi:hypothetical protein